MREAQLARERENTLKNIADKQKAEAEAAEAGVSSAGPSAAAPAAPAAGQKRRNRWDSAGGDEA